MKKISYIQKIHILLIVQFLAFVIIAVLYVMKGSGWIWERNSRILSGIILGTTGVILVLFIGNLIFEFWVYYRKLCEKFAKGEIYREFILKIGMLAPGLEEAVHRMDMLVDRQKTIQLSTKQAELLALQNQINPHFLYNTLDAIRGDALCIGAENIADITEALSTFFRYTITDTKSLVTLQEELDNVEDYFKIQRYRFGEKMSLTVNLKDDEEFLMKLRCPKLSLQPIVENAIFHGIEKQIENGQISIEIEIVDQELHVDISDNGVGMEEKVMMQLNEQLSRASVGYIVDDERGKRGGIALKNVSRRIKLLFGEEYGLHINSIIGLGTKVEVVLPVVTGKSES